MDKKKQKNTDNQKNAEHQNLIISQADNLSILVNSDRVCGSHWQPVKTSLRKKHHLLLVSCGKIHIVPQSKIESNV